MRVNWLVRNEMSEVLYGFKYKPRKIIGMFISGTSYRDIQDGSFALLFESDDRYSHIEPGELVYEPIELVEGADNWELITPRKE